MMIAKTPIKQDTRPTNLKKLIFSLKKKYEIIIINTGEDV